MKSDPNPKVVVNWQPADRPSEYWIRLWRLLLTHRKEKPVGTHEAADNGEMSNGKDGNLQNL